MSGDSLCDSIYTNVVSLLSSDRDMRRANRSFAAMPRSDCGQVADDMVVGFTGVTVARLGHIRDIMGDTYPGADVRLNNGLLEVSVPICDEAARLASPQVSWLRVLWRPLLFVLLLAVFAHWFMPDVSTASLRWLLRWLEQLMAPAAVRAAAAKIRK